MDDQPHPEPRWALRWLGELVVAALLVSGVVIVQFDLGDKLLGQAGDPVTAPAEVPPPEGLKLTELEPVPEVARTRGEAAADPARVAAAIGPLLQRRRVLGGHVGVLVTDLGSGRQVYRSGASLVTPASTTKMLTSAAALASLGPMARFRTTVRWDETTRTLVLVGGGDPFLASDPREARRGYPSKSDVLTLARKAAQQLRSRGVRRVRVAFDDSYFTGPSVNPAWPGSYIPEGVVPPITALWVNEGRAPGRESFVSDPAAEAGRVFADAVRASGIKVKPEVGRATAGPDAVEVAKAESAPLGQIVERVLAVSDNQAAEVLARHVGLAEKQEGSFVAGTAAILDVLAGLEVDVRGNQLYDGSGLSRQNLLSPGAIASVVRLATSAEHPELRPVLTGLPVAGFTGSLANRFARGPEQARGRVRAKTGTLTGVRGLAGLADDATGARMAFVVVADRIRPVMDYRAQGLIDRVAGALGACRCAVGSAP